MFSILFYGFRSRSLAEKDGTTARTDLKEDRFAEHNINPSRHGMDPIRYQNPCQKSAAGFEV